MYNHDKSAGYHLCSIIRMSHDPRDHTQSYGHWRCVNRYTAVGFLSEVTYARVPSTRTGAAQSWQAKVSNNLLQIAPRHRISGAFPPAIFAFSDEWGFHVK
jgi:hypothetical protein